MKHAACQTPSISKKTWNDSSSEKSQYEYGRRCRRTIQSEIARRIRLHYAKRNEARFTSHLDTVRMFSRSFRRAGIPLIFSQGYHAHPKIATGPPLPLGFTSRAEYMDIEVPDKLPPDFEEKMNEHLHYGFKILETKYILKKVVSLNYAINRASYHILFYDPIDLEKLQANVLSFISKESFFVRRRRKTEEKEVNIRPYVDTISINDGIDLVLRIDPEGTVKVNEVLDVICPGKEQSQSAFRIERTGQFLENDGQRLSPMEII